VEGELLVAASPDRQRRAQPTIGRAVRDGVTGAE
jgi:hypothetical protein